MAKFTKRPKQLIAAMCIGIFILSSCVQEADVAPADESPFDAELTEVLDLMENESMAALEKLDELIIKAESVNSKYYAGKAKWYKAYIYDEIIEDVSLAYHNYNEALRDVLETDDSSLKMKIYNNLGILYRFYGEYDAAIANYESALKLEDNLTIEQLSDVYYNYGVALKLKGDGASFLDAEQAFTKSLDYAKQIEFHENIANVYNQIGLMYKAVENYEMSRIAYNNTIRTFVGNPELHNRVGMAYHGIGVTYMEEENTEASIRAFNKALEYKSSSGSIFITKYDLGTVLARDGRTDEAITVWKDALTEKHNKNSAEQVQIYSDLTSVLKQDNRFEEALDYSQIYNSSMRGILQEGETYKSKSDKVLFANVVNEYDEFNRPTPLFARPLVILLASLAMIVLAYAIVLMQYRSRSKKKLTEVVSKIQTKFLDIKVD